MSLIPAQASLGIRLILLSSCVLFRNAIRVAMTPPEYRLCFWISNALAVSGMQRVGNPSCPITSHPTIYQVTSTRGLRAHAELPFRLVLFPLNHLLLGGSGLLGGVAPQLPRGLGLQGPLGAADGADTSDRGRPEVGAVAVLGGLVGNGPISPSKGVSKP
ncbi:hypothetical protein VTH06DRAFT_1215 [Thermothelomyces fergusii]